jgi:glycerophosphoryl diester phosphodiesterase/predicted phosphodiesterase
MSRTAKTILIIILLLVLCLLAGAWLLFVESQSERAIQRATLGPKVCDIVTSGFDVVSEAASSVGDEALGEWMTADRVYSHRGSAGRNEHSFEAYDAAIEAGSHNIEQDVVISGDGTLYVSHDLTAAAMTGDGRSYSSMSDAEIDSLTTYAGGHILKLSEVFEHYGKNVKYLVELKSSDDATIDAFVKEVDSHDMADQIIVQSQELAVLDKLEETYPKMPKLMVIKTSGGLQQAMSSENVDMVGARVQFVNEANCNEAHDRGKKFVGWTLDSESEIMNAINIGADAYFTNDTPLAIELERKYRPYKISNHSTIFFASDYQPESGFDAPKDTLSALLESAISDGKNPDSLVVCGDFTNDGNLYNYQLSPDDSISEIKDVVREKAPQIQTNNMIFVQGNHDAMGDQISSTGLHEYDNYLVYVLNTEEDFPWSQGKTSGSHDKVSKAAKEMEARFSELISKGETRPVFIAGHVPLHYSARTSSRHTTGDNLYSSLIFDVVNEAAKSLDIIYVHGHNHSKGWDCYMGGAAAYKAVGDSILIPVFHDGDITTDEFEARELNFTYMNAGYTGYYMNCSPSDYGDESYRAADETLSATVCEVYKDRIEITRYDANGRHVLGAAGEANPYKGGIDEGLIGSEYYSKETESPATINRRIDSSKDANEVKTDEAA